MSNTKVFLDCAAIAQMETFGQRVKRLRELRGLTQSQLAKQAGFSHQSAIGNIESGKREGSRNLASLAAALSVDPFYLETGKGTPAGISDEAIQIARIFDSLPQADRQRLSRIIAAALGPAVSDQDVEDKMPVTKPAVRRQ